MVKVDLIFKSLPFKFNLFIDAACNILFFLMYFLLVDFLFILKSSYYKILIPKKILIFFIFNSVTKTI